MSTRRSLAARVHGHPRHASLLLVTCLAAIFATMYTSTILTVSVTSVADDLGSSAEVITWVITAPMLAQAVCMPILGRMGDLRGHRRVFLVGLSLAGLFSILAAVAWDAASLITFRSIAQLSGGAAVPASLAMLFRTFPAERRQQASGWVSSMFAGSSVIGLAFGGVLIDWIGWRPLFVIQAVLTLAVVVVATFVLTRDTPTTKVPLDKAGAAALGVASFTLAFGVNRLAAWGLHPVVIVLAAICPLAVWALIRIERRAAEPLLPLALTTHRGVRVALAGSSLMGAAHMGSFLITPLLLQSVFLYSATVTSLITIARTLSISVAGPMSGLLERNLGGRRVAISAGVLYAAGCAVMALGSASESIMLVVPGLVVSGVAFGCMQPLMITLAASSAGPEHMGLASSLQQTSMQIGAVTGMSLCSAIVGAAVVSGPFVGAFLASAILALLAAVAVVPRVRTRVDSPDLVLADH